jgi:hypothetical protein
MLRNMITIPTDNLEGLLVALEGFFGPEIFMPTETSEPRLAALHEHGSHLKHLLDKKRVEEAAAKSIYEATESQLDDADKENLQDILDDNVHGCVSEEGSDVNNVGREEQILFLIRAQGEQETRNQLREAFEGRLNV